MTRVRMLVCGVIVTVGLAVPSAQTPAVQSLDGKAAAFMGQGHRPDADVHRSAD